MDTKKKTNDRWYRAYYTEQFNVSVTKKTNMHPFFEQGYPYGYVINGIEGVKLNLTRGKTYLFNISARGHPFYLTSSPVGGPDPGRKFSKTVDQGDLIVTIDDNFPNHLYYQCGIHEKMGGVVEILPNQSSVHHSITLKKITISF